MTTQEIVKRKLCAADVELHKTLPLSFEDDKITFSTYLWERLQQLVLHKHARYTTEEVERRKTVWTGSRNQVIIYTVTRHIFEPTSKGRPDTPPPRHTTRARKYSFPRAPLEA